MYALPPPCSTLLFDNVFNVAHVCNLILENRPSKKPRLSQTVAEADNDEFHSDRKVLVTFLSKDFIQ